MYLCAYLHPPRLFFQLWHFLSYWLQRIMPETFGLPPTRPWPAGLELVPSVVCLDRTNTLFGLQKLCLRLTEAIILARRGWPNTSPPSSGNAQALLVSASAAAPQRAAFICPSTDLPVVSLYLEKLWVLCLLSIYRSRPPLTPHRNAFRNPLSLLASLLWDASGRDSSALTVPSWGCFSCK